ncbi:MAG: 50S ribosomal protein L5 [Candidatus Hodarchaeales archaeon]|jgi:large subunit ribosomal protein L5
MNTKQYEKVWENISRKPKIEKVVMNLAVGRSGPELERARTLAESLTGKKPADSRAKESVRGFAIRKGEPIGCHVTLRGEEAEEFLKKTFYALEDKLLIKNFDNTGNVSVTIHDHLNLPNVKYDPKIGVFGFTVTANLERQGYRIKRRRLQRRKIPSKHRITKDEAIAWFLANFENLQIQDRFEEEFI